MTKNNRYLVQKYYTSKNLVGVSD